MVQPSHPSMCAEDFSEYLTVTKGAFLWLGTGSEQCFPLHNARFTIDETILEKGVLLMSGIVAERLCK